MNGFERLNRYQWRRRSDVLTIDLWPGSRKFHVWETAKGAGRAGTLEWGICRESSELEARLNTPLSEYQSTWQPDPRPLADQGVLSAREAFLARRNAEDDLIDYDATPRCPKGDAK